MFGNLIPSIPSPWVWNDLVEVGSSKNFPKPLAAHQKKNITIVAVMNCLTKNEQFISDKFEI